jgi:hypothetical protein
MISPLAGVPMNRDMKKNSSDNMTGSALLDFVHYLRYILRKWLYTAKHEKSEYSHLDDTPFYDTPTQRVLAECLPRGTLIYEKNSPIIKPSSPSRIHLQQASRQEAASVPELASCPPSSEAPAYAEPTQPPPDPPCPSSGCCTACSA